MDLTLMKTKYDFKNKVAETAARKFFTELRKCDGKLKVRIVKVKHDI